MLARALESPLASTNCSLVERKIIFKEIQYYTETLKYTYNSIGKLVYDYQIIKFMFPPIMKTITTQATYNIWNIIGEIGGWIGLFIGLSIVDAIDIIINGIMAISNVYEKYA